MKTEGREYSVAFEDAIYLGGSMKIIRVKAGFVMLVLAVIMLSWGIGYSEENDLGLQSTQAIGEKRVLIVVVRFPDAAPTVPIEMVKRKAVSGLNTYVVEQSYGLASINVDFRGYITLPSSLSQVQGESIQQSSRCRKSTKTC